MIKKSKKGQPYKTEDNFPSLNTQMKQLYGGGLMSGVDNSVWIYGVVPMEAVTTAKTRADAVAAGNALSQVYQELANITPPGITKKRSQNKGNYRETHLLLLNTPKPYSPPRNHRNASYWANNYGNQWVNNRLLLIGVRVKSKVGGEDRDLKAIFNSIASTFAEGGEPVEDFYPDAGKVARIFRDAGIEIPTQEQINLANGYWDWDNVSEVTSLPHSDHIHFFRDAEGIRIANSVGKDNCFDWDQESTWTDSKGNAYLPGESSISFSYLDSMDLPDDLSAGHSVSRWVANMMARRVRVVSVRAKVEPCRNTYHELRAARKKVNSDLAQMFQTNQLSKSDVEERESRLGELDNVYSNPDGPATLIETSIVIGTEGHGLEYRAVPGVKIEPTSLRQLQAWQETMLTSGIVCVPKNYDFSVPVIANSGIQSLAVTGEDSGGALLGFTEVDRQPVYISATVASDEDAAPLMLVAGQTGSGKSMTMLHIADQFSREGRPQVIIDPKRGSFHDAAIVGDGRNENKVVPLGSLTGMDGIFDPIRFSPKRDEEELNDAITLAVGLLLELDPWGSVEAARSYEPILPRILRYGVIKGGADCIGEALEFAFDALGDAKVPAALVDPIIDAAENDPYFRSMCGLEHGGQSLAVGNGITYIRVGNTNIGTPAAGVAPRTLVERTACALIRMMVFASSAAVSGRSGVVHLDEAWIFLQSNPGEIDKLARLARSQLIFPILYTQKVSDALKAGIHGAIGRTLIMSIKDRREAEYACELVGIEQTPERLERITALQVTGSNSRTPNWNSMRPLFDPDSPRKVTRGAIGIYSDFYGRVANVEIMIAPEFLAKASTNPLDIAKRKELAAQEAIEASSLPKMKQLTK